jgi:hypothetical protein
VVGGKGMNGTNRKTIIESLDWAGLDLAVYEDMYGTVQIVLRDTNEVARLAELIYQGARHAA